MGENIDDSAFARLPRAAVASSDTAILRMVMEEIVLTMRARGAALSLHDGGTYPAIELYRGDTISAPDCDALLVTCQTVGAELKDNELVWRSLPQDDRLKAAIVPVERVPGHSRLLITVIFDGPAAEVEENAERVYRERRAFAVGYFHFWQLNRLHMRRYLALEAALECTAIGVLLVDRSSHILFANSAAEEILASADGLTKRNGSLHATHLSDGVNLSAALSYISSATGLSERSGTTRAPLISFRRKEGPALVATIVPTRSEAIEERDVAATVYLVDPRLNMTKNLTPICQLYELSPVETRLACLLATGEPLADAADKMRVKEQTARSYLKSIFIKTATNRQTALVALLLSSLMRMKGDVLQEALPKGEADKALLRFT